MKYTHGVSSRSTPHQIAETRLLALVVVIGVIVVLMAG